MTKYTEVLPKNFFKFKKIGDCIEGTLKSITTEVFQHEEVKKIIVIDNKKIIVSEGLEIYGWDELLNKVIKITYITDKVESNKFITFKVFKVEVAE